MHAEDRLDALLSDVATFDVRHTQLSHHEPDVAPLLRAAAQLRPLSAQLPDVDFAHSLEARLIERTSVLRSASTFQPGAVQHDAPTLAGRARPADDDAPTLPGIISISDARAGGHPWPVAQPGINTQRARRRGGRARIWWPAVAAALLIVIGGGTLTAAASAGPGSPLFALHQLERGVQANISSPTDRVRADLQASDAALAALNMATSQHGASDDSAYTDALSQLLNEQQAATHDLADVPSGADHDALSAQVRDAQARARASLHASLRASGVLSWGNRLAASSGLNALGESVTVVASARVELATSDGDSSGSTSHGGDARWRVTLTGTGFLPGATLILNGQPVRTELVTVTADQLIAIARPDSDAQQFGSSRSITSVGVLNSDGTAAETTHVDVAAAAQSTPGTSDGSHDSGGHDSSGGSSGHGGSHDSTPTPTSSPSGEK